MEVVSIDLIADYQMTIVECPVCSSTSRDTFALWQHINLVHVSIGCFQVRTFLKNTVVVSARIVVSVTKDAGLDVIAHLDPTALVVVE